MSGLKVGMLGPIAWRTPPRHYGPWERVTSLLTEGLVRRGVDVTLFATADSITSAHLDPVAARPYNEDPTVDGRVWEALHVAHALERSGEFDLIHNQLDCLPLAFGRVWQAPMITTIHGFSGDAILPAYESAPSSFVSISDSDRSPKLKYLATVHHGIDFGEFEFTPNPTGYLVTFGRIHPDKGVEDAIDIAARAGRRLVICGIVHDEGYFASRILPHIDDDRVVFRGSLGPEDRSEVLGNASVLLHPIHFDEPFGLSVVEAMACGTPVVAYRRGSMPEVIDDGLTGFAVADAAEAVTRIADAELLDRRAVRRRAEARFGVERMVDEYLRLYDRVITNWAARDTPNPEV